MTMNTAMPSRRIDITTPVRCMPSGRRVTCLTVAERARCMAAVAQADRDGAITVLRRVREDRHDATPTAPVRSVFRVEVAAPVDRIERTWVGNLALAVLVMMACGWAAWSAADRLLPRHASASTPTLVATPTVDAISGGSLDLR